MLTFSLIFRKMFDVKLKINLMFFHFISKYIQCAKAAISVDSVLLLLALLNSGNRWVWPHFLIENFCLGACCGWVALCCLSRTPPVIGIEWSLHTQKSHLKSGSFKSDAIFFFKKPERNHSKFGFVMHLIPFYDFHFLTFVT